MPSLRVNQEAVARLRDECDTDRQMAIRLGVDPATACRVLRGKQSPGNKFIAGVIKTFGVGALLQFFDIVEEG